MIGAGFWARYQLAGWHEAAKDMGGVECVGIYNRTRAKAEALARDFGALPVFDDVESMLRETRPDFADIVTDVGTHAKYTKLAARMGIPVVCQKPLAVSYEEAVEMLDACRAAGVLLYVNENWRWQTPIRELKRRMDCAGIGDIFRARIRMVSGFRLFDPIRDRDLSPKAREAARALVERDPELATAPALRAAMARFEARWISESIAAGVG